MGRDEPIRLGLWEYFLDRGPGGRLSDVINYDHSRNGDSRILYFDKKAGLLVHQAAYQKRMPDDSTELVYSHAYVGPEGISDIPDDQLGRFIEPITHKLTHVWYRRARIVFDKKLRRFFRIDLNNKQVTAGPEIPPDDDHNPIQVVSLQKNADHSNGILAIETHFPMKQLRAKENDERHNRLAGELYEEPLAYLTTGGGPYTLVLDASGRIDLLDNETLEFAGTAGNLYGPSGFFGGSGHKSATLNGLLGYQALSLSVVPVDDWKQPDNAPYSGMCLASISRDGTSGFLAVFDEKGKLIKSDFSKAYGNASAEQVFFGRPWSPVWTIVKYALENIHPPVLSLASYFTADSIEAAAGHRAMFILPNSFIAMKARDTSVETLERIFEAVMLIAPGIALAVLFAFLINRDAVRLGFSENARLYWIIAAASLGLVAYVTYRLTRPGITLVTCANCGKPRRPDMPTCHRCSSKWMVPELVPPLWRVLDQ